MLVVAPDGRLSLSLAQLPIQFPNVRVLLCESALKVEYLLAQVGHIGSLSGIGGILGDSPTNDHHQDSPDRADNGKDNSGDCPYINPRGC